MPRYSKSVLLVDDNPADRTLFGRDLSRLGFDVILTGSADEAMAAIVAGNIGCLVTDQVMTVPGQELASLASGVRADLGILCSCRVLWARGNPSRPALYLFNDGVSQACTVIFLGMHETLAP